MAAGCIGGRVGVGSGIVVSFYGDAGTKKPLIHVVVS